MEFRVCSQFYLLWQVILVLWSIALISFSLSSSGDFQYGWSLCQALASGQIMSLLRSVLHASIIHYIIQNWVCIQNRQLVFIPQAMSLQLAMGKFTQKIVEMMKAERLFHSQGAPIILSQVLFHSFPYSQVIPANFSVSFLKLCSFRLSETDWERIRAWSEGIWGSRNSVYELGRKNGSWNGHWCPLGYVQRRWCPWPSGIGTFLNITNFWAFHFLVQ